MRRFGIAFTAVIALTALAVPTAVGAPVIEGPKTYVVRGEIALPGYTFITFEEWNLISCPEIPRTQGVSSYFIPIPKGFRTKQATVEVTGRSSSGGAVTDMEVTFWAEDCTPILVKVPTPVQVPTGAVFIQVDAPVSVDVTFELTISRPR